MWMCSENAPLSVTDDPVVPEPSNDPAFIPLDFVLKTIESQPGTTLDDLLSLG